MPGSNRENQMERAEHVFLPALPGQKIIAITGTIGSGKSTVAKILASRYPVIDCDRVNAELLLPGGPAYDALRALPFVKVDDQGQIDKPAMAKAIFGDASKKAAVEGILHPRIFERVQAWILQQQAPVVFVEMPVLFEIGAECRFKTIWCVTCDENVALQRLMEQRHFSREDAKARIANQWDARKKKAGSSVVIDNSASRQALQTKVAALMERLEASEKREN